MWAWAMLLAALLVQLWCWKRSGLKLFDFTGFLLIRLYTQLWQRCTFRGVELLPAQGPLLLVANHTASPDAAFLSSAVRPRVLGYLIAQEYQLPVVNRLLCYMGCVPVKRDGQDIAAVRQALVRLSAGRALCIFPEGGLSNAGRRRPRRGKAGAALLALRSGAPVHPVFISGGPQTGDILRAWVCPSPRRTWITFGPAIDLSSVRGRPIRRPVIEETMRLIHQALIRLGNQQKEDRP